LCRLSFGQRVHGGVESCLSGGDVTAAGLRFPKGRLCCCHFGLCCAEGVGLRHDERRLFGR